MGRKTDVLMRGFRAAKCLTLLKLATARIKVLRNKRSISAKQMRMEIAKLLRTGQDSQVYISKVDALIKQENMVAVYDLIDQYCHAVISRFPMIEIQRNCPPDVKEAIASLIYAAPRCVELSELAGIKEAFLAKYGKEFVTSAAELRPDCGVNPQVIEFLMTRPASGQVKLKLMKEICAEHNVQWTPGEALGESIRNQPMVPPNQHVEVKVESVKVDGRPASLPAVAVPSRIDEAGPSSSSGPYGKAHSQGDGSKLGAVHKVGLAAVESLQKSSGAMLAAAAPGLKHVISSQASSGRGTGSSPESLNVAMNAGVLDAGSLKAGDVATVSAVPSELFQTKTTTMPEDQVITGEGSSPSQSCVGVTDMSIASVDIESLDKGEVEAALLQPADDAQDGLTDSDESFVSIEEEGLEDEVNSILKAAASRRESLRKEPVEASVDADLSGPSLSRKPFGETGENSVATEILHDEACFGVSSKDSNLSIKSSFKDTTVKVSTWTSFGTDTQNKKDELAESKGKGLAGVFSLGSRTESLKMEQLNGHNASKGIEDRKLAKPVVHDLPEVNECQSALEETEKPKEDDTCEGKETEKLVEHEPPFETQEENMLSLEVTRQESNQNASMGTLTNLEESENRNVLPEPLVSASQMLKVDSFSENLGEDIKLKLQKASQNVDGRVVVVSPEDSSDCVRNQVSGVPTKEPISQKMSHDTPADIRTSPDDFAATAAAIAAEAARLAVLDYAKRMAGSSSVPFDLSDLTKLGLAFGDNMQGKHVEDILNNGAKDAALGAQKLPNGMTMRKDVAGNDKAVEVHVQDADDGKGGHPSVDEMSYVWDVTEGGDKHGIKQEATEDGSNADTSGMTRVELKNSPEAGMEIDDINPFARRGKTELGMLTNSFSKKMEPDDNKSLFSFKEEDEEASNWVGWPEHGLTKKAGMVVQEDDHLDIFFRRKSSRIPVEEPKIHEDPYSFAEVKTSFAKETLFSSHHEQKGDDVPDKSLLKTSFDVQPHKQNTSIFFEENMPPSLFSSHHEQKGDDVPDKSLTKTFFDVQPHKQNTPIFFEENMPSSFHYERLDEVHQNLMPKPVFDDLPQEENRVAGEGPESFRRPVFDEGFDDETGVYNTSFSFNDCVDNGTSTGQRVGDQSPPRTAGPTTADVEPQPCFDEFPDEAEESSHKKTGSIPLGWNSKPSKTHQQTEETSTATKESSSISDALPGGSSYPMSRRSRRKPQKVHEHVCGSELVLGTEDDGRSSHSKSKKHAMSSTGLQETEKVTQNENSQEFRPVESLADSKDAVSELPLRTPNWVSKRKEDVESELNRWDVASLSDSISNKSMKSFNVLPHEESDEVYSVPKGKNQVASRTGPGSKVTIKSSTEEAKQKPPLQGYNEFQEDTDRPEPPRPEKVNFKTHPPSRPAEAKQKPPLQGYNKFQEDTDRPEPPQPEKVNFKTHPPSRPPPAVSPLSTFPPLESSISDPIILATMPPPVKKPVTLPASTPTKLETSSSAPPSTAISMASSSIGLPDEKAPKLPQKPQNQKPPSVDDLAARFEALRRARRGE